MAATLVSGTALTPATVAQSKLPGLLLVAITVGLAAAVAAIVDGVPMLVASLVAGIAIANSGLATQATTPGLSYAAKTILRLGIVLLGLRLAIGDVIGLGGATLAVIVVTVVTTFFGVQLLGRRLGLSGNLSLLVASGFSICGNSAVASVNGVADAEDEEVAAAIGLVTLAGTAAVVVLPVFGALFGLNDTQLGVWVGASVQDTAQVIAVGSAAGPLVLAVATAVKLTRVLLLAPIVAGLAVWKRRTDQPTGAERPALVPLFVVGFLAMIMLRSSGLVATDVLEAARSVSGFALAAGMVGLGSSARLAELRRVGPMSLALGGAAWLIVGSVSLASIALGHIG